MKEKRLSGCPKAKVSCLRHPGALRAVPCKCTLNQLVCQEKEAVNFPEQSASRHPASRASFNFPAAENWEEKEALHKSRQFFEVAAAPKFGLVSPDKTGFLQREHYFLGKTDGQNRAHSTKTEATFA